MKFNISRTWCGIFTAVTTVGTGLGLTAYLANNAGVYIRDEVHSGGETLLNLRIEPPPLEVGVIPEGWPFAPIMVTLKNLLVVIRDAMPKDGVNLFENYLPQVAGDASRTVVWIGGAVLTLAALLLVAQGMNACQIRRLEKEIAELKEKYQELQSQNEVSCSSHYVSINQSP